MEGNVKMKCKDCVGLSITRFVNTDKQYNKQYRLCFNPITVVVRPGGVLLQDCHYNEGYEHECPYNKEVKS